MLGNVGTNSANEFFETIIFGVGYNEARQEIASITKDVDNSVLQDAIQSSMNVLVMALIMKSIQAQEKIIEVIFDKAEVLFTALLLAPARRALAKIRNMRGVKLFRKMGFFQNSNQENIMTAQIVATNMGLKAVASSSSSNSSKSMKALELSNDTKKTLYAREELHMGIGNNMASRYNETLLFKLFTKSFTPNDELLIKKILGRDTATELNVSDLNQVADFLFVKDSAGKVIGLSEAFFNLTNGMGYFHNK